MFTRLRPLSVLALRLFAVVGIYGLLRLCFWALNRGQFPAPPATAFLGGLRFDLMALAWINLPWALLVLIDPAPGRRSARLQCWTFLVTNAVGLFFNCVDIAYYAFTLKRSTADLFGIMGAGNDLANLVPVFLRDYWYIVLIYGASLLLAARCYRWADQVPGAGVAARPWWLWRVLVIALFGVATRGGIQLIPLGVLGASAYAEPAYMPVVLNTPFTIIKSIGRPVLEERVFMAQDKADRLWPVRHTFADDTTRTLAVTSPGTRPNVVVIILESFSAAYSQRLSGQATGYMPFLDSLMAEGLTFSRAYANGRRSIDGVPAILAAMPKLSEEAFISSPYATIPFTSFASVLKEQGYATSFFHGGRNGTMGFDTFTRSAGYDRYVGRDEYPYDGDDDGSWGIRDRPFLQFYAAELARMPQPFHSVAFTLSSHHPYRLAPEDEQRYSGGTMPIHPTLRYADDALRAFFRTAGTMPWFRNTLFVITADHTADLERNGQLSGSAFDLWIPLVYYMPGHIAPQQVDRTTQQIDILPTTLDLIGHPTPFFSFGSSALRNDRLPSAVSEGSATWMIVTDSVELRSDGERVLWVGPAPGLPDPGASTVDKANRTLQAAIQQFHAHLLQRDLVVK